jgi:putative redox protein
MTKNNITVETEYIGGLRTQAKHLRSGNVLVTDAPVDNNGRGEAFSPTDLLATSLGSCMMTIIGIAANAHGFDVNGAKLETTKVMAENPRRVGEIIIEITFPHDNYSEKERKLIEAAVKTCPVALSLHPDLKQTIKLIF